MADVELVEEDMQKEPYESNYGDHDADAVEDRNKEAIENDEKIAQQQSVNMKKEIFEWIQAIVIALVIALLIRSYVFSLIKVNGHSMQPTLYHNERLVVTKLMYTPSQGDIIILDPPAHQQGPYVKRIMAVEGQTIDIDYNNGKIYVDGVELQEDYIKERISSRGNIALPMKVPENTAFVLGDNRNNSRDSRYKDIGVIPYENIIGKVTVRIWPLDRLGSVYNN